MKQFAAGVAATLATLGLGAAGFLGLGYAPIEVDAPPLPFEELIAHRARVASLHRQATDGDNPLPDTPENIRGGREIYEHHCSGCHGDRDKPDNPFATQVYPPVPQFFHEAPDLPPAKSFYVTKHGIRLTAMPAFGIGPKPELSDDEIWKVTLYLRSLDEETHPHAPRGNHSSKPAHKQASPT